MVSARWLQAQGAEAQTNKAWLVKEERHKSCPPPPTPQLVAQRFSLHKKRTKAGDHMCSANETASLFRKHIQHKAASRHPASLNAPCTGEIKLLVRLLASQ